LVFSSLTFLLLFLPIVTGLYFAKNNLNWRNTVLVIASVLFYAWGEPVWVLGMIVSTLINYVCAIAIVRSRSSLMRKLSLTIGIIASVALLFYFKYAAFLFNSVSGLFGAGAMLPVLELPIGISFYTFQILTYSVDVYRGKAQYQKNPAWLLLYVSCFPQLIAGPIVQYGDVAAMILDRKSTVDGFVSGMKRFAFGLAKKVILANICGAALEQLTLAGGGQSMSVAGAWYGAFMYSLQIYFDFSAYSDMAIGLGRVFGFKYKENFDYPYISKSVTEFWRRWHISLGSFFRDYIYIPLGGNRKGVARNIINLLIVWALTGLWHGASWNFVLWGLYYGIILIAEKFLLKKVISKTPAWITHITTLLFVMVGWILFYYTDLSAVSQHLLAMVGFDSAAGTGAVFCDAVTLAVMRKYTVFPLFAALCCTPVFKKLRTFVLDKFDGIGQGAETVAATAILVLSVMFLIGQSYNPFIYFRF